MPDAKSIVLWHCAEAPTCWKSHAWIQLLLEGPPHKQSMKEGLGHKSKRRKKAAADCDQDPLLTSLWMPSKRLLLSSLSSCIQASASAGKPTSEVSALCRCWAFIMAVVLVQLLQSFFWAFAGHYQAISAAEKC